VLKFGEQFGQGTFFRAQDDYLVLGLRLIIQRVIVCHASNVARRPI
jgi:hypothetical protein